MVSTPLHGKLSFTLAPPLIGGLLFFFHFSIDSNTAENIYLRPRVILSHNVTQLSKLAILPKELQDLEITLPNQSYQELKESDLFALLPNSYQTCRILGGKTEIIILDQKFTKEEITESLTEEIKKRLKKEDEFRITYLGDEVYLPSGLTKEWANFPKDLTAGMKIFTLNAIKNGRRIYSQRLKFLLEKKIQVAIVKKQVPRFHVIQKEDVELRSLYTEEHEKDLINFIPEGFVALVNLEPEMMLRKKHLRIVQAVQRRNEVETVYTIGNITVKGKAIAKQNGNIGDTIQLSSIPHNVQLKGKIIEKGVVEVE
ncbi:MAG: flagellar basal body P-ring formation chaperone FlgA [Leptospiraceae bacterium]|nr:flagellar basal body P-ring formation chaperone FlgA [Leptospiraceae bacterium]